MLPGRKYTLDDILGILWKGRWIIAVPVFVGTFGGAARVAHAAPTSTAAQATVQVLPQRVPDAYVRTTVTSTVEERLKTIEGLISSRTQLEQMITEFNLYPGAARRQLDGGRGRARRNKALTVEVAGRTRPDAGRCPARSPRSRSPSPIPTATSRSRSRSGSPTSLIDENSRMRERPADQTNQFLESQLADAERRLEEQDQKLEAFRQRYAGRLPTSCSRNMQAVQTHADGAAAALAESIARDRDRKPCSSGCYHDASQDLENCRGGAAAPATGQSADPNALPTRHRAAAARGGARQPRRSSSCASSPSIPTSARQEPDSRARAAGRGRGASRPARRRRHHARRAPCRRRAAARRERLREQRDEIDSLGRQIAFKEGEEAALRGRHGRLPGAHRIDPGHRVGMERADARLQHAAGNLQDACSAKSEESKISANLERRQIGEQFRMLDAPRVSPACGRGAAGCRSTPAASSSAWSSASRSSASASSSTPASAPRADVFNVLALPVLAVVPFAPTAADLARDRRQQRAVVHDGRGGTSRSAAPWSSTCVSGNSSSRGRRDRHAEQRLADHRPAQETKVMGRIDEALSHDIRRTDRDRDGPGGALARTSFESPWSFDGAAAQSGAAPALDARRRRRRATRRARADGALPRLQRRR